MRLRKFLLTLAVLLPLTCWGRQKVQGYCELGGGTVTTQGYVSSSSTKVQRSYPSCTVTVYLAGGLTLATIYSDDAGTPKANPFTAASDGFWFFYAENGHFDVKMSGGGIGAPFTRGDHYAWDHKAVGVRNVMESGAVKADGSTDDQAAIQAVINAASSGDTVFFPPGSYHLHSTLIPKSGVKLVCAGRSSRFNLDTAISVFDNASVTDPANHQSDVLIEDCRITGINVGGAPGINLEYCDHCTIRGNRVENIGANMANGIGISLYYGDDGRVEDNYVMYAGWNGIRLYEQTNTRVHGNTSEYTLGGQGITVVGDCSGFDISGNVVRYNGKTEEPVPGHLGEGNPGIMVIENASMSKTGTISHNIVTDNGDHGIQVIYYASGAGPLGITSAYRGITITGNVVRGHKTNPFGGAGIIVEGGRIVTMTGNAVYDNNWGFSLGLADSYVISSNTIESNVLFGIVLAGSINGTIAGNGIYRNGSHGIDLRSVLTVIPNQHSIRNLVANNTIQSNVGEDINVQNNNCPNFYLGNVTSKVVADACTVGLNSYANNSLPTDKWGTTQACKKYTLTNADLTAADFEQSITLVTLGNRDKVTGVSVKHSASFTGGAITAMNVEVADSTGGNAFYSDAFNVFQAPGATVFQDTVLFKSANLGAGTSVRARFVSTGGMVNAATAGSVDIVVCKISIP